MTPKSSKTSEESPSLSRSFEHALDNQLRSLFQDLAHEIPYHAFRDVLSATEFKTLLNLAIYDTWWEEDDKDLEKWLRVPAKKLDDYRRHDQYPALIAVAKDRLEDLSKSRKYAEWIERPEVQDRLARTQIRLLSSSDPKVREKAATSLTDRIQPRLTKGQERHEVHTVIQISDGFGRRLFEADEEAKRLDVVDSHAVLLPASEDDPGEEPE